MKKAMLSLFGTFFIVILFIGCDNRPAIGDGMTVKITYKGTLADGTVFDSSEGREPLEFNYGAQQIIPGLETGMKGLKTGDKKTITVAAADAYGTYDETKIQEFPKTDMPAELADVTAGTQLYYQSPMGPMPVTVKEVKENSLLMDFNHPLAGKDLTFAIEVMEVTKTPAEAAPSGEAPATAEEAPVEAPTEAPAQ